MDPIAQLQSAVADVKSKINAVLTGLPPLEQYEATSEMSYGIRSLQRYCNELMETAINLGAQVGTIVTAATDAAKTEAVTATRNKMLTEEGYVSKTDHESAVTAAVTAKETEVRTALTAETAVKETVAARRVELVTDKVVPGIVAHKMPAALLEGDGYKDNAAKVATRFATLKTDTGISAEAADLSEDQRVVVEGIASLGLEAADETTFTTRLGLMKTAVTAAKKGTGAAAAGDINPLAGAAAAGATTPAPAVDGAPAYRPNLL